ncbi:MAG: hypothetical protein ABI743_04045 [bacterium]
MPRKPIAAPAPPPGPGSRDLEDLAQFEDDRNAAIERQDVERWLSQVPSIKSLRPYRAQFEMLGDYLVEVELEGEDLHLWRAYRELIMQRLTGVYDDFLGLTDIIVQDLFYFFVRNEHLAQVKSRYAKKVVPLTFLGRSEDYYYTYAGDHALPIVVVSIPQSRVGSVWNWLAIPHEVGHHILAHFAGYEDELSMQVVRGLKPLKLEVTRHTYPLRTPTKALVATIWFNWLEEVVADIFGILFTGPAQVMARQEDACRMLPYGVGAEGSLFDSQHGGFSRYPTCFVRCLFQSDVLRYLGYGDWADKLDARWIRRWGNLPELHWYDDAPMDEGATRIPLFSMSVETVRRTFRALLPLILDTPVDAFGGASLRSIAHYDEEDHARVERISAGLLAGQTAFERKDRARHILAASRFAFETAPSQQEEIHATAVEAILNCRKWL